MDILDLLSGKYENNRFVDELCKSTGAESDKMQEGIKLAIPTLVQGMAKNANTQQGAQSLAEALERHKNNEIDPPEDFLRNVDQEDGNKIIDHIFGANKINIQNNLSKQTGLGGSQVSGMLAQLAPLLLGMLGKQKSSNNVCAGGLSSMLMGLLGNVGGSGIMDTVKNMIDGNNDGSIMDDITKMAGGFFNKDE